MPISLLCSARTSAYLNKINQGEINKEFVREKREVHRGRHRVSQVNTCTAEYKNTIQDGMQAYITFVLLTE